MHPKRYPIEVTAAYVLGAALPVLEICRRRSDFSDIPGYLDDFIIGALLLIAARSAARHRPYGQSLLAGAWGVLCGGLWGSFFGQLHSTSARDISGLPHAPVIAVKLLIYVIAVLCFGLAIRRSATRSRD